MSCKILARYTVNNTQKTNVKKRDFFQPKGRQVDDRVMDVVSNILGEMPLRRDLLIEALHKIQDRFGVMGSPELAALAEIFKLSQVEVYEVASFYHHFDIVKEEETPPFKSKLRICDGLSCEMAGAKHIIEEITDKLKGANVTIQKVPCIGRCGDAPAGMFDLFPIDKLNLEKVLKIK